MSETLRLDKYLADLGVGTRSQVKQMIRKGLVDINGNTAKKPEQKVDVREDRITVEGKELQYTKY